MPPAFDTPDLCTRIRTNYLMALNVPLYLGMPNLPLLITEDTRFHRAFSFPFKTELPDDDADGTW